MWQMLPYVGSGFTLIAFLAAVSAWIWRSQILKQERLIRSLPEGERKHQLVEATLEFFTVDTNNLTKEQQYNIALMQIHNRSQKVLITAIVITLLAVLASALSAFAIHRASNISALEQQLSNVDRDRKALEDVIKAVALREFSATVNVAADQRAFESSLNKLTVTLGEFSSRFGDQQLGETDNLRVRLAKGVRENAQSNYLEALKTVTENDEQRERRATEAQHDRELSVLWVRGDGFLGLQRWDAALARYQRIIKIDENDVLAHCKAGFCLQQARSDRSAVSEYTKAINIMNSIKSQDVGFDRRIALGNIYSMRSTAHNALLEWGAAIEDGKRSIELCREIIKDHITESNSISLAGSLMHYAVVLRNIGKLDDAIKCLEEAISILTPYSNKNKDSIDLLASCFDNIGNCYEAKLDHSRSLASYEKAIELRTSIANANADSKNRFSKSKSNRGAALNSLRRWKEAEDELVESTAMSRQLVVSGHDEYRSNLGTALVNLGVARVSLSHYSDAVTSFSEAISCLEIVNNRHDDKEISSTLARALTGRVISNFTLKKTDGLLDDLRQARGYTTDKKLLDLIDSYERRLAK